MTQFNIRIINELLRISSEQLSSVFGTDGPYVHRLARGIDLSPVSPIRAAAPQVCEQTVFAGHTNNDTEIERGLFEAVSRAGVRLRGLGVVCARLVLVLWYSDGLRRQGSYAQGVPVNGDLSLYERFFTVLHKVHTRRVRLSRMGIECRELTAPYGQMDLFESGERERRLMEAMDSVRAKFGRGSLVFSGRSQGVSPR